MPEFLQKTISFPNTVYLNSRGTTNEILSSVYFAGRILNHVHEGIGKGGQPYKFVHTAFLQLYQDSIVGLEIKANGFQDQAAC